VINFAAIGIGGLATRSGVVGEWYLGLNKAPWTPPGWVFGAAWTTIMVCFSIFMAYAWEAVADQKTLLTFFILQLILNIGWNPIFFVSQEVAMGLFVISALTILLFSFFWRYKIEMGGKIYLLMPYIIWLVIATSLNAYVLLNN